MGNHGEDFVFGKIGMVWVNAREQGNKELSLFYRPLGGYGYSGLVWEPAGGKLKLKQGPKIIASGYITGQTIYVDGGSTA